MYIYKYILYTYTYIHACTCAHMHMHTHARTRAHAHTHTHAHAHMHAHTHAHAHAHAHARTHTHTSTHTHTHTYTCMHTHRHASPPHTFQSSLCGSWSCTSRHCLNASPPLALPECPFPPSFARVTHMWDMMHLYAGHASIIYGTGFSRMWDMTYSMWNVTHSYVVYDGM